MPPPAKPATTAGGMVWDGVASFNAFTVNWEAKNKEAWEAAVTDDIDMYVEGNHWSNNTGKDKVWAFRGVLPDAPDGNLLWTNMYDSWHFDPNDANTLKNLQVMIIVKFTMRLIQIGMVV